MKKEISILMPVYNRERMIAQAIKSILLQTFKNFELIIFDDGSKDRTKEIVNNFMMSDDRIRLIWNEKNNGVAHARNELLNATKRKFACWQDSDDVSNIHRIENQLNFLRKKECSLLFANYIIHDEYGFNIMYKSKEWMKPPIVDAKILTGFATSMFILNDVGKFNEKKRLGGEDLSWLKNIKYKSGMKERLYYIQFHDDRIGVWKRRLRQLSGYTGINNSEIEQDATYEEMIEKYKKETR